MTAQGKILVIRGGAIGDFILTLPVLAALRRQFPETQLEILAYPNVAALAVAGGLAHAARPIESRPMASFFARGGELHPDMADYFSRFAIILSYLYDPDGIFQDNVARASHGQFIQGPHRPDEKQNLHATAVLLQPLERLAIFDADARPQLRVEMSGENPLAAGRWLALHPGSGSESKNWPERHWAELLATLAAGTDVNFLLIGGEAEGERLARLAAPLPPARRALAARLPLPELAHRLQCCAGFVGHDSGISHLAAAVGLPGIVLWGDTAEAVWRPPSGRVALVRDPRGLAALPVPQVARQVEAMLNLD
ncbi:MAG: glycosyltransferase family 9 protein [Verrucomicrobia bacterium]|nr:glycosyltransferase family 9 protein [Verrucomicrobiota bacterium]